MSQFEPCKKDGHSDYFGECLICTIKELHSQNALLVEALEYSVKQVPELGSVPGIASALAAVKGGA